MSYNVLTLMRIPPGRWEQFIIEYSNIRPLGGYGQFIIGYSNILPPGGWEIFIIGYSNIRPPGGGEHTSIGYRNSIGQLVHWNNLSLDTVIVGYISMISIVKIFYS